VHLLVFGICDIMYILSHHIFIILLVLGGILVIVEVLKKFWLFCRFRRILVIGIFGDFWVSSIILKVFRDEFLSF